MKTYKLTIFVKDPDSLGELQQYLNLSEEMCEKYFKWGECAIFELEIDSQLKIVSGKILPIK